MQVCHHCGHEIRLAPYYTFRCTCKPNKHKEVICIHGIKDMGITMHLCTKCVPLDKMDYVLDNIRRWLGQQIQTRTYKVAKVEMPASKVRPNFINEDNFLSYRLPRTTLTEENSKVVKHLKQSNNGPIPAISSCPILVTGFNTPGSVKDYYADFMKDDGCESVNFAESPTAVYSTRTVTRKNGLEISQGVIFFRKYKYGVSMINRNKKLLKNP